MITSPFWCYYGGKFKAAPRYPGPGRRIIEPFAGAAGYSLRYHDRDVLLIDAFDKISEVWRFLIGATRDDIMSIPLVDAVDDLPDSVPQEGKWLVGWRLAAGAMYPRWKASTYAIHNGWTAITRERCARQVALIKHWRVVHGSYTDATDESATWFIDPPYNNKAGSKYKFSGVDYSALAEWCLSRRGRVIVCENEGATWLPFRRMRTLRGINATSVEAIWWRDTEPVPGTQAVFDFGVVAEMEG
ncbi:MAG: hypothetical protein GY944_24505 [bacterium]|nr:hypothetical protein [bacterium]